MTTMVRLHSITGETSGRRGVALHRARVKAECALGYRLCPAEEGGKNAIA